MQPDDRIQRLENKIRLLEQEKAGESCANAPATLRKHLNRPPSLFDLFEVTELLETHCILQGAPPFVGSLPPLELVASCPGLVDLTHLRFFDPGHFRAGNIHNKLSLWQDLLEKSPCSEVDLVEVIRDGVRVDRFFKPFRRNFKRQAYNSEYLPLSFTSSFPIP